MPLFCYACSIAVIRRDLCKKTRRTRVLILPTASTAHPAWLAVLVRVLHGQALGCRCFPLLRTSPGFSKEGSDHFWTSHPDTVQIMLCRHVGKAQHPCRSLFLRIPLHQSTCVQVLYGQLAPLLHDLLGQRLALDFDRCAILIRPWPRRLPDLL